LGDDDFKDGKLTVAGYDNLKNQCDYIDYLEEIVIKIPPDKKDTFKDSLEFLAANELSKIKKDRIEARAASLILLGGGVLFFLLGNLLEFMRRELFFNIVLIACWVFIWAAIEKWFFDRKDLRERRKSILQILAGRIELIDGDR